MLSWMHARCRNRIAAEQALSAAGAAMTAAAREGAPAVLRALAAALAALDPAIDAVLAFVPEGDELACIFTAGERTEYFGGLHLRADGTTLPAQAVANGHHVTLRRDEKPLIPTDRAAIAVPFYTGRTLTAVMYASATSPVQLAHGMLARAAAQAAIPYALACERDADRADATYDGLTGLYTARAFRRVLQSDVRAAELGRCVTVSLWFVDTDGFKNVNDTFGHAAGDLVLQRIARLLTEHLTADVDLGARNGGDEFCAVLRNAHKTHAIARAQAFCDAVRAFDFGVSAPITASIGVSAFPYDASSAAQLLELADAAMYHSKRSGRDRVAYPDGEGGFTVHR
jgi:diguanylate cyclase (GGDEF)-like protein